MNGIELAKHVCETLVAAWPGPAALDAKTVALTDGVQIRQVRHAPAAS
jgi:hypothetical protein